MKLKCMKWTALAIATVMGTHVYASDLTFVTGSQGGTWYPAGGAIKSAVEDLTNDVSVKVRPGSGLANLQAVEMGRAQLAMSNTISAVDAVNGKPPFKKPLNKVCNVAYLYPQAIQPVVVNTEITKLEELVGHKLAVTPRGNTAEQLAKLTLDAVGVQYDDLSRVSFASMSDQVNMMKDGQVDGFFQATSVPSGAVMDVAASREIRLLPINDEAFNKLKQSNSGFTRLTIPANTYPGMDAPVDTVSFGAHVVASCDVDENAIYKVTKAIHEKLPELSVAIAAMKTTTPKLMAQNVGIPHHKGALKYYQEAGLLD